MGQIFCGLAEELTGAEAGYMRQWARGHVISWGVQAVPRGFSATDYKDIVTAWWDAWKAVANVQTVYSSNFRTANLVLGVQQMDGPMGVLAKAELPSPNQTSGQLNCWFDSGETFILAQNPPPGKIDVLRVGMHEGGHNLGLGHASTGSRNLMAPTISDIRQPQPDWDVPQVLGRYGDPAATPGPGPQPPNDDLMRWLAELFGILAQNCQPEDLQDGGRVLRDVLDAWRNSR